MADEVHTTEKSITGLISEFDRILSEGKTTAIEIYDLVNELSDAAIKEARTHSANEEFEKAARTYLVVSDALKNGATKTHDRDVFETLVDIGITLRKTAEIEIQSEISFFMHSAIFLNDQGTYKEAVALKNKAKDLEYKLSVGMGFLENVANAEETKDYGLPEKIMLTARHTPSKPKEEWQAKVGWYAWQVVLDTGKDIMEQVEKVTYNLPPRFLKNKITAKDRSDKFELDIVGGPGFEVRADIYFKNGKMLSKYHWLDVKG